MEPIVRVISASLGAAAQVRLAVSGVSDPDRLRAAWASSGATVERVGERLVAVSTVAALERAAGRCLPVPEAGRLEEVARAAVTAWVSPTPSWHLPGGPLSLAGPQVMAVCNVTPDSFFDGGAVYPDGHPEAAVRLGRRQLEEGAAMVDVGGESSRPGAQPVSAEEELARVLPVVEALASDGAVVSIDTTKPEVAAAAIEAGAQVVNDVAGGRTELLEVVARSGAAYVLMHSRGAPADMHLHTSYDDVVAEVFEFLAEGLERCEQAGIERERVAVDPGIGFAKTAEQSFALLRAVPQLRSLGRPLVVGASRKSFLGSVLDDAGTGERLEGSLAVAAVAAAHGAALLRVHDVAETVRAVRVADALREPPTATS